MTPPSLTPGMYPFTSSHIPTHTSSYHTLSPTLSYTCLTLPSLLGGEPSLKNRHQLPSSHPPLIPLIYTLSHAQYPLLSPPPQSPIIPTLPPLLGGEPSLENRHQLPSHPPLLHPSLSPSHTPHMHLLTRTIPTLTPPLLGGEPTLKNRHQLPSHPPLLHSSLPFSCTHIISRVHTFSLTHMNPLSFRWRTLP